MKQKTAVFVPLYNEHERIGDVLRDIKDASQGRIDMLVVVDDGSTDGSADIASRYTRHVLRLGSNCGNGTATRKALKYISDMADDWSAVIRIDGDGQHDPSMLPHVFSALDHGADVVLCSRFHKESDTSHAMLDRHLLNGAMAHLTGKVTGWPVSDARSGFLGFRWESLKPVISSLRVERYGIPMELLLRIWHANQKAKYHEIPHPAKYERGLSQRLDSKYRVETKAQKVARMSEAYSVFLETCASLGLETH